MLDFTDDNLSRTLAAAVTAHMRRSECTSDSIKRRLQTPVNVWTVADWLGALVDMGLLYRDRRSDGYVDFRPTAAGYRAAGVKPPIWDGA